MQLVEQLQRLQTQLRPCGRVQLMPLMQLQPVQMLIPVTVAVARSPGPL